MWTKVSICLFLKRIPVTKLLIRPIEAAIVLLILSNVIITILWIVQCRPVDAAWNANVQGSCFSKGQLERIVLAQASKPTHLFSYYSALWLLRCPASYFRYIRLCLRRLSHLDPMEDSNEVEHKDWPVLPDGTWRSVGSIPVQEPSSCRY